jgi:hypothetical protein
MVSKYLALLTLSILSLSLWAQEPAISTSWSDNPEYTAVAPENEKENVVGLLFDEKYKYYYDSDGNLLTTHAMHRKFRINSDDAINNFNKLSVSLSNVIDVIDIKARVIKPNGKVIDFDKKNIKEIKDEQEGKSFKIFAIDGIEVGDEVEHLIVRKMYGSNFGRTFFQFEFPMQKTSFEITSPKNLIYAVKGYNGYPNAKHEVLADEQNRFHCELDSIPSLKDEKYAYFTPRRARVEFKLDYNYVRGRSKILTWNDASQRIYEMIYLDVNTKKVDKWLKALNLKEGSSLSKAAQIEDYLKRNIYIQDFHTPEFSDFEYIRNKKVTSERGIVTLYANLFKALNIKHEIVLTCERNVVKFDPDFHSWNYLDKYLIYLPDGDTYIDPAVFSYRMGCVDGDLTATDGLFIGIVKIGNYESAVGKIKYIKPTPYSANYDNMNIEISVNPDKGETNVITTRGLKGLSGGYLNIVYKTVDEERKQTILKDIMETKAPNPVFKSLKVLDKSSIDFLSNADFIIHCDFATNSFIEMAGNKLLLNIGESIGPQMEMYFDEDRKIVAEYSNNRQYYRKIIVNVPEGYRIVNPEVADFNITEKSGDDIIYAFVSSHTYEGNVFTVSIDEYYKEIFTKLEHFEGFKNVVNAAADFNKVVLVLEKL